MNKFVKKALFREFQRQVGLENLPHLVLEQLVEATNTSHGFIVTRKEQRFSMSH